MARRDAWRMRGKLRGVHHVGYKDNEIACLVEQQPSSSRQNRLTMGVRHVVNGSRQVFCPTEERARRTKVDNAIVFGRQYKLHLAIETGLTFTMDRSGNADDVHTGVV